MSQLAVLPTRKAFSCANPKPSIARGQQATNGAAGKMFARWRLPWDGSNAIEAKQSEFRTEPEITVGRLSNSIDVAFEKAVAGRPRGVRILIDVERRV